MVEPQLKDAVWRYRSESLNSRRRGSETTDGLAWDIVHAIEPVEASNRDETFRHLWFRLARGSVDDWMTAAEYAEYIDDGYFDQEEKPPADDKAREKDWLEWYPQDAYWHELEVVHDVVRGEDWIVVAIDGETICEVFPSESLYDCDGLPPRYGAPGLDLVLESLVEIVASSVAGIADGSYAEQIEQDLPYEFRYGLVKRRDFWEATSGDGRFGCVEIQDGERKRLVDALRSQPAEGDVPVIPELTTGRYFEALKGAYERCGYVLGRDMVWLGIPAGDARQWYARFGDGRDESLFEVDPDSPEAFEGWYESKESRLDHNFEIFAGRGCTRVHLNPRLVEGGGWRLHLYGSITWHAVDMARVWEHMNAEGLHTYVHDADAIADAIEGEDCLLIVPKHKSCDYVSGEHFGHLISTALPLWQDGREAIAAVTQWQPVEMPRLAQCPTITAV